MKSYTYEELQKIVKVQAAYIILLMILAAIITVISLIMIYENKDAYSKYKDLNDSIDEAYQEGCGNCLFNFNEIVYRSAFENNTLAYIDNNLNLTYINLEAFCQ